MYFFKLVLFILFKVTVNGLSGYSHNQEMNFINGNNPNLITVTGKLNKVRNKKNPTKGVGLVQCGLRHSLIEN
jgi:hypothetical protein